MRGQSSTSAVEQQADGQAVVLRRLAGIEKLGHVHPATPHVYRARVRRATTQQSIASNTVTTVAPDLEDEDVDGLHAAGVFTAPVAGWWRFTASVVWAALIAQEWFVQGVATAGSGALPTGLFGTYRANGTGGARVTLEVTLPLNAGNIVTWQVFQNSGGAVTVQAQAIWSLMPG